MTNCSEVNFWVTYYTPTKCRLRYLYRIFTKNFWISRFILMTTWYESRIINNTLFFFLGTWTGHGAFWIADLSEEHTTQFGLIGSQILIFTALCQNLEIENLATQKSIEWANKFIFQLPFKNLFTRGILSKFQIFMQIIFWSFLMI